MRYILMMTVAALVVAQALDAQGHDHANHTASAASASPALEAEVEAEVEAVRRATERYRDIEVARREGYRLFGMEGPPVRPGVSRAGPRQCPRLTVAGRPPRLLTMRTCRPCRQSPSKANVELARVQRR